MGRVRNSTSEGHRAGPLKQANKKHKTGRHRSKGMLDVQTRGRVTSMDTISKKQKAQGSRSERKRQAAVERIKKIQEVQDQKSKLGGARGAPIAVALLPLAPTTDVKFMLKFILANVSAGAGTVVGSSPQATQIKLTSGKNILLMTPPSNDIWTVLDTMKQADIALFLMPVLDEITPEGLTLLKTAKEQGLPTPFLAVTSTFNKSEEKAFQKSIHKLLPIEKIFPTTNPGQIANLLRMISVSKITIPKQWSLRSNIFIENYCPLNTVDPASLHPNYVAGQETNCQGLLEITGIIRRKNLNPYKPLLISGAGSWQILRADSTPLEVPKELIKNPEQLEAASSFSGVGALPPRFLFDPSSVPAEEEEVKSEAGDEVEMNSDIDDLDDEDFAEGDSDDDDESQMSLDGEEKDKKKKRLPKGTSEYQADWLVNSDGEAEAGIVGSDEELENDEDKDKSEEEEEGDEEDDEMDWEEEKKQIQKAKDARTEAEFPDWVDTPMETAAKIRFQKYRGLQSFKTSKWDVNENLPRDYGKIFQFQNYRHVAKMVVGDKAVDDGPGFIPIGQRMTLILKPLDEIASKFSHTFGQCKLTSAVSLLRHENRMSVLNLQLNLTEIVKNKEELIFQVGHHRFQARPILSEISPGNNHKMLRFGQVNESVMATIFGPIVFPTASVLAFKSTSKAELIPVGSGHLFSIDPNRLVIKRVLLSGHPFKVSNKNAVIRYMFFNREDIDWFKPIELRTRYGRRGHIKEPLGTHGHMKCSFDGTMKSQDTVLMPLYKRVFPKWNYEPSIPSFQIYDSYQK